jgi:hypothetical protein
MQNTDLRFSHDFTLNSRLVAGFPPRRFGFEPRSGMWDLWWTKWHWCRFSLSTSVFPASSHPTDCSTFIIIVPSGLSLIPPQETKKKKKNCTEMFYRLLNYAGSLDEHEFHVHAMHVPY